MAVAAEVDQPDTEPETAEPVEEPETVEEPEEEEEGEGAPAVAPEPVEPGPELLSEKQLAAARAKLDKEAERHRGRLTEIMGEEALLLVPCALCEQDFAGWRFPVMPDEEQWRAITAAVYGEQAVSYNKAAYAQRCTECAGLGQIATDSLVPGRSSIDCRACMGFGYVTQDTTVTPLASVTAPTTPTPGFGPPDEPKPDADPWGRPKGDPNFGVLPGYEK